MLTFFFDQLQSRNDILKEEVLQMKGLFEKIEALGKVP